MTSMAHLLASEPLVRVGEGVMEGDAWFDAGRDEVRACDTGTGHDFAERGQALPKPGIFRKSASRPSAPTSAPA